MPPTNCPHGNPDHELVQRLFKGRPHGWRCRLKRVFGPKAPPTCDLCGGFKTKKHTWWLCLACFTRHGKLRVAPPPPVDYSICPNDPLHPPRTHAKRGGWYCNACNRATYRANPESARARMRGPQRSGRVQLLKAERMARILEIKGSTPCTDCHQQFHPRQMEFDHLPERGAKAFELSSPGGRSWAAIEEEMAKCEIVCSNCHRLRTWQRRQHLAA